MGIGAPMVSLYYQLAREGALSGVKRIIEFGSQDMHCAGYENLLNRVISAMGKEPFDQASLMNAGNGGPARNFYERLGWEYQCIDTDGRHGALTLDLNFDVAPEQHKGRYDVATNFGTTEHLINQLNAFRTLHDLTKPGGLMLHILPFVGCVDHGFFTYQPNFFYALARFNSYEMAGIWFNANTNLASLIPWEHGMLKYISVAPTQDAVIVVAQRKMYPSDFKVPFQGVYEASQVPDNAARYDYVIDGLSTNGMRVSHLSSAGLGRQMALEKEVEAGLGRQMALEKEMESLREQIHYLRGGVGGTLVRAVNFIRSRL
jgi:hypothetical protein